MATIKMCTDIRQSMILANILNLESADMYYDRYGTPNVIDNIETYKSIKNDKYQHLIPCWSLAASYGVLPMIDFTTPQLIGTPKTLYRCMYNDDLKSHAYDNPVDACYEMIEKLHELNLL